jgi:hypothetical protein
LGAGAGFGAGVGAGFDEGKSPVLCANATPPPQSSKAKLITKIFRGMGDSLRCCGVILPRA